MAVETKDSGNLYAEPLIKWIHRSWANLALSSIVFILVGLVWWRLSIAYELSLIDQNRSALQLRGNRIGNSLSSIITQKQATLNGLAAFVKTHSPNDLRDHYFSIYAAGIWANDPTIRAIQFLPNVGPILVYPLEGNEAVANRTLEQLRNDERANVREDVRRAIESQKITLSAPYELRQGGKGLVARLAVYEQGQFLGLVSIVLNIEPLLSVPGLNPTPTDFRFAIKDSNQQVFFGEDIVLSSNPVLSPIQLPEGSWTLAIMPAAGWSADIKDQMFFFLLAGFLLSLLAAVSTYYLAKRQSWLSETLKTQSEEMLLRDKKLQLAADASGIGFFEWDFENNLIHFSPEWKRQIGFEAGEIQDNYQEFRNRLHPDDVEKTLDLVNDCFKNPSIGYEAEFRLMHKNGSYRWILARGFIQTNPAGEPVSMLGCHIDVTRQKENAAELLASEHRFRGLAESSPDYIMLYDHECRHVYENPAGLKVSGMTEADIIGKTHREAGFSDDLSEMWEKDIRTVFVTGNSTQRLFEWEGVNGKVFLDWRLSPIFAEDGQVELVLGVSRDITSIKQTEEALRESENRLRFALEGANDGLWDVDMRTDKVYLSPRGCDILGYLPEELAEITSQWHELVHPDDMPETTLRLNQHIQGNSPLFQIEQRLRTKSGDWKWILTRGKLVERDPDGNPLRMTGTHTDISERKQAEEKLRESEERFSTVFFTNPLSQSIISQTTGTVIEVNDICCSLYGFFREELIGVESGQLNLWANPADQLAVANELKKSGHLLPTEVMIRRKSGEIRTILFAVEPIAWKGTPCFVTTSADITERKRAENEIARLAERLDIATRSAHLGVWDWDIQNDILIWDERMYELYGLKKENFSGAYQAWLNGLHPEDRVRSDEAIKQALGNEREYNIEFRVVWLDGTIRWLKAYGRVVFASDGQPQRMIGINYDVTERKQAEETLQQRNIFIENILEHAPIGFAVNRISTGQGTFISSKFDAIYGVPRGGMNTVDEYFNSVYLDPNFREQMRDRMLTDMASGDATRMHWENIPITTSSGEFRVVTAINIPLFEQDLMISTVQDVTERWQVEEEVRKLNAELEKRVSERTTQLEATNKELEAFSYSVSHDLRTPLRGIDGWSLALSEDYRDILDDKARQYINRIRQETQRMGLLIDDILRLSRLTRAEMKKGTVNLSSLAQDIARRLMDAQSDRSVEWVIQPNLVVFGDAQLLEIALTNLLSNAFKFTSKLHHACIEFGQIQVDEKMAYFVRDNGAGFNMAYAKNLFGAFQRMHKQSDFSGTGIGLATTQRIIHRHGGRIWADAEKNKGATFYFILEEMQGK